MKANFLGAMLAVLAASLFVCCNGQQASAPVKQETPAPMPMPEKKAEGMVTIPANLDVANAAPDVYKKLADTLNVRIFEITFKPGQTAPMHQHPDHAIYCLSAGTLEVTDKDGKKTKLDLKPGMALVSPGEMHTATNVGKTPVKAVVVEVNRPRM